MPHAIERLFATPMTRPRLPAIRPPALTLAPAAAIFLHPSRAHAPCRRASYTNRPTGPEHWIGRNAGDCTRLWAETSRTVCRSKTELILLFGTIELWSQAMKLYYAPG